MSKTIEKLSLTINGNTIQRERVRADQLLIDFLHEELGLTGTKFSCGVGACGACKVALREAPGAPPIPVLACFARMNAVNNMHLTTVEGLSRDGELHPLQRAFLEDHAFQCGFSTPGFLMAAYVLMERLREEPVTEEQLEQTILDAIGGNLCRCTGYVRYFRAIRRVILATPGLVASKAEAPTYPEHAITFRLLKQSRNDLHSKVLIGYFEKPEGRDRFDGELTFAGGLHFDTCRGWLAVSPRQIRTGERVRDLNLVKFFFRSAGTQLRFDLQRVFPLDGKGTLADMLKGATIPVSIEGTIRFGAFSVPAELEALVTRSEGDMLRVTSRSPVRFDQRNLGFEVAGFSLEFGLELGDIVEVTVDLKLPYTIV